MFVQYRGHNVWTLISDDDLIWSLFAQSEICGDNDISREKLVDMRYVVFIEQIK